MNVLLVEDDAGDADLTRRALVHYAPHIRLDTVTTLGEARVRLAGAAPYDLVVTDMALPDGSGLDLVAAIRTRGLPIAVVALTGATAVASAVAALKAGADDYVVKQGDYLLRLPAVLDAALARFRAETARRARPLRVLYAEDSTADVDLTRRHLARHAPHVHLDVAHNADELFARLPASAVEPARYDVVLLDYQLGGQDALHVLKILRHERHLEIPVVVVTGEGDGEAAAHAFRFGAADFLVKQPGYVFQLTAALETVCDRAQLQREQAALRESEERFRILFEQAAVGMAEVDSNTGRLIRVNQKYGDILGYSREELLQLDFMYLTHPDDLAADLTEMERLKAGETREFSMEKRLLRKDGTVVWVNLAVSPMWAPGAKPTHHIAAVEDIGTRRLAEARFQNLFEFSPDAVFLVDRHGLITMASQQALVLFGYTREEIVGLPVEALMPVPSQHVHVDMRKQFLEAGMPRVMGKGRLLHARKKDGTVFPVDISLSPLESEEGPLVVAAVRDATAREQAARERESLEAQLRHAQKIEALGKLAGGIAHDFNNILGAIMGHVELATHHVEGTGPAMKSIEGIRRASTRAQELVRQILSFSRQQPLTESVIALPPAVEEAVGLLRATIPVDVELAVTVEAHIPEVLADPTQIHQVVVNLCANAWQAMEGKPGRIDVHLAGVTIDEAAARRHAELLPGRYARLSVVDTGRGMDAITLDRMFEPFFTTKDVGGGTGLGLSVVHGIVRAHGGVIDARSELGRGTTFHVYFPAVDAPATTVTVEIAGPVIGRGQGQQVLFLDDEEELVLLARDILELGGYRVSGYTRATEALEALRADPTSFAAVVSDVSMPGMSGLEFAREVARLRSDLPVVLTSGHLTDELRAQAAIDTRAVLGKPYNSRALVEIIDRLIPGANDA